VNVLNVLLVLVPINVLVRQECVERVAKTIDGEQLVADLLVLSRYEPAVEIIADHMTLGVEALLLANEHVDKVCPPLLRIPLFLQHLGRASHVTQIGRNKEARGPLESNHLG